jgi:hypothetical protein
MHLCVLFEFVKSFRRNANKKNFHVVRIFTGEKVVRWKVGIRKTDGKVGGGIRKFKLLFYSCISILTHQQGE